MIGYNITIYLWLRNPPETFISSYDSIEFYTTDNGTVFAAIKDKNGNWHNVSVENIETISFG